MTFILFACNAKQIVPEDDKYPDKGNYLLIDGLYNYRFYSASDSNPVVHFGNYYRWISQLFGKPDDGVMLEVGGNSAGGLLLVRHINNYVAYSYSKRLTSAFPLAIVANDTILEFKNLRMYEGFNADTTQPSKLVSGKITLYRKK